MIKSVALVINPTNSKAQLYANKIVKKFTAKKIQFSYININSDKKIQSFDLVLAIGGDGTMIHACRYFGELGIPVIGINHGHLGFLTDLSDITADKHLDEILAGKFYARQRNMLEVTVTSQTSKKAKPTKQVFTAVNDFYINKPKLISILDINIFDNKEFLIAIRADGLIMATPTGSTAYALSCGGPIVHPRAGGYVLCAVAPHSLTHRPIVMPEDFSLTIKLPNLTKQTPASLFADGQEIANLDENSVLKICQSKTTFTLAHPHDYNFYQNLRNKLRWNEEIAR